MTTRPDNATLQQQKLHRSQTLCTLFRVQRKDGFVLRFTDHDRPITDGAGELFVPLALGSISAERREAALRSGNQEARGIVDGTIITIPDLLGNRYRGARVIQRIVDWRKPWLVNYGATKIVRQMTWDGSRWIATLEGIAARLQRPVGGRFGALFTTTCGYTLGEPDTCRADITSETFVDVRVTAAIDNRMVVEFNASDMPGTFTDDYFRDGEVEWTLGDNVGTVSPIVGYIHTSRKVTLLFPTPFPIAVNDEATVRPGCDGLLTTCRDKFRTLVQSGTSTGGNSTTVLNHAGAGWTVDEHVGRFVIVASQGERPIVSNTATALTVSPAWAGVPTAEAYKIRDSNVLNHGGDPFAPGAAKVLEQKE